MRRKISNRYSPYTHTFSGHKTREGTPLTKVFKAVPVNFRNDGVGLV